jgi:hypothetical protein
VITSIFSKILKLAFRTDLLINILSDIFGESRLILPVVLKNRSGSALVEGIEFGVKT